MIKNLLRICSAMGCRSTGLLGRAERQNRFRLSILSYHRILPAELKRQYYNPDLVVTPESFREHCRVLREQFEVLPLSEAVLQWRNNLFSERPIAAITFDDGYWDNHHYAAAVLNELKLPATFFVIADLVGTDISPWYDQIGRAVQALHQSSATSNSTATSEDRRRHPEASPVAMIARLKQMPPRQRYREMIQVLKLCPIPADNDRIMSWKELTQLVEAGHEIGSHSMTHEILPLLDQARLRTEVLSSRQLLQQRLGQPVRSFCHPNGDTDARVTSLVKAAGYANAVTTAIGANLPHHDVYLLKRWFMHEDRLSGFAGTSATLLRMELANLANRVFMRST